MRNAILIISLLFVPIAASAQNPGGPECPTVQIVGPGGGYLGVGDTYYVSANLSPQADEARYEWTFSDGLEFKEQGKPVVSFVANKQYSGRKITVRLTVKNLPRGCIAEATDSFEIHFNLGSPIVLDEFGLPSKLDEIERLGALAGQLKNLPDVRALFVVQYVSTDTKNSLKSRVRRIISTLKDKYSVPVKRFTFVFSESDSKHIRIYAWKADSPSPDHWISDIDKLKIRN